MNNICIVCLKDFIFNKTLSSHRNKTCSYDCLKKTDYIRLSFLKTFFKNRNMPINTDDLLILEKKFAEIMSQITKISTIKKHETIIKKHGSLKIGYGIASNKSVPVRMKNFILNNNLVSIDDFNSLSLEEIKKIYRSNYDKLTDHGSKIHNGRLLKYGSIENVKNSYRKSTIKTALNYFNLSLDFINDEKYANDIVKQYKQHIKFCNHDSLKWKITHLKNKGIDTDGLDSLRINELYSEYMSARYNRNSLNNPLNGYSRTKKGWYNFLNINKKYFYRSSWELKVLEELDTLIKSKHVISIFEPKRISYIFDNINRYYYPDIGYVLADNTIHIVEIKPMSKILENKIFEKMIAGLKFNVNVLTEVGIFGGNLSQILLKG